MNTFARIRAMGGALACSLLAVTSYAAVSQTITVNTASIQSGSVMVIIGGGGSTATGVWP